jgi:hypothetical protein
MFAMLCMSAAMKAAVTVLRDLSRATDRLQCWLLQVFYDVGYAL